MHTNMVRILASSLLALALLSCADGKTTSESPAGGAARATRSDISTGSMRTTAGETEALSVATREGENLPPVLTISGFALSSTGQGDSIGVNTKVYNPDDDEVTLEYEWYKNGELAGTEKTFSGFKRGDKLSVTIVPRDSLHEGRGRTLTTEIVNSSPRIGGIRQVRDAEGTMILQVDASDPDADALSYSLEAGSPGMTIDGSTGRITWAVPAEFSGESRSAVVVNDGHGGSARFEFVASAP